MSDRNRSQGWQHAKLSGHENEELIKKTIMEEPEFQALLCNRLGKGTAKIAEIDISGLKEKNVPCILTENGTTKSKTDIYLVMDDNTKLNISIKKSLGGQVYLIGDNRFIDGFELHYKKTIPENIKRAIHLFWGSADDTIKIASALNGQYIAYEKRKHRLVAETLKKYNEDYHKALLEWFNENIAFITDFCFSKGLAKKPEDWANVIWYINELGENSVDEIFLIDDLINASNISAKYGTIGGGTTIQLFFGFVQWHSPKKKIPGEMQFHHSYKKIASALKL